MATKKNTKKTETAPKTVQTVEQAAPVVVETPVTEKKGKETAAKAEPKVEDKNPKAQEASRRAQELTERNTAIVAAILNGEPRKAVADRFKVSPSRIHELLVAAGYKKPYAKNADRDAAILADFQAGKKIQTIATDTGLSASRIKLIVAGASCQPLPKTEKEEVKA
jgi:hypothetical protein